MFYVSPPFALVMLLAAHFAARRHPHPIRWGWFLLCGIVADGMGGPVVAKMFVPLVVALPAAA